MSPDQQRIAIAEACGWEDLQINLDSPSGYIGKHKGIPCYMHSVPYQGYDKAGSHRSDYGHKVPDYLNDLNAMHDAEKVLVKMPEKRITYAHYLMNATCKDWASFHASAAQRAEAFLKTLKLWKP